MLRTLLLGLIIHVSGILNAQSISGIVNRYTAVTAVDSCLGILQVADTSGFFKGDAVLLIQMQGASISGANNSTYGNILSVQNSGLYERAILDSISEDAFFLRYRMLNHYDAAGKMQVVRIARYTSATVADTVFAKPWDGQTGGILALEVSDTLTLNAPLWAEGAGFRGGQASFVPGNNCNFLIPEAGYYYAPGNWRGSRKGEGIAVFETNKELGRGPQANGGGGGNDHNSGGGGGGHIGRGGTGGENDEPSALGCDGYYPGIGGNELPNDLNRLFMGGGGGAGHANNTLSGSGGNGGGIIMLSADVVTGVQPLLSVRGVSAGTADGDGGGGGGAGGSVWLKVQDAPLDLQVLAEGGNGGNTSNNTSNRCFGPGGGGNGGRILTNLTALGAPAGGQPGVVTNSTNGCNGSSNSATAGESGIVDDLPPVREGVYANYPEILLQPRSDTICGERTYSFPVLLNTPGWLFQWQQNTGGAWMNANSGFSNTQTDTLLLNTVFLSQNGMFLRLRVTRPGCFAIYSDTIQLSVRYSPYPSFNTVLQGDTITFNNTTLFGQGYQWNFGDQQTSEEVSPQHVYAEDGVYTVSLTGYNECDTVTVAQEITVVLLPTAAFDAPDSVSACEAVSVPFFNQSSDNSNTFEWQFPGGAPESSTEANPEVLYTTSGDYAVTLTASNVGGSNTSTQIIHVEILDIPVAEFTYTMQPGGVVAFVNTSQGVAGLSWNFGDGSPLVAADSLVSHTYLFNGAYTVTLTATNVCGASVFQQTIQVETGMVGTTNLPSIQHIRLYPNPADDYLIIDCSLLETPPDEVCISDVAGRIVFSKLGFTDWKPAVSVKNLPAGAYLVQIRVGNQLARRILIRA